MPRQHATAWQTRSNQRGTDGGQVRSIEELEGTWMNVDCPREQYVIRGLRITRSDARGTRDFMMHWDRSRQRWRWGTHGRLSLQWLGEDVIAWVPDSAWDADDARMWRWQRCGQAPRSAPNDGAGSGYRPWRRSHNRHRTQEPYSRRPRSDRADEALEDWRSSGSRHRDSHNHDGRRHGHHHSHHRSHHRDHHSNYSSQRRDRQSSQNFRRSDHSFRRFHTVVGDMQANAVLPCGLTAAEVYSLLSREIMPEDYELLLRLDETIPKPTISAEGFKHLTSVTCDDFMGGKCSVCLSTFEEQDSVAGLPCEHYFHHSCITTWLSEYRRTCPLCCAEALPAENSG